MLKLLYPCGLLIAFIMIASLSSCSLFDDEPLIEPNDPCAEVHEVYPNVGLDSCSWVLNVMRNYPPPEFLPPPTDTGGPLMAARILTDTGEVLFVAQGVPDRFLGTPCNWWRSRLNIDRSLFFVGGGYCSRPPVDQKSIDLSFFLSDSLRLYQEPNAFKLILRYRNTLFDHTYELQDSLNFIVSNIEHRNNLRILSGQFEATLHNRRDPTDSIRIVDGRFDMRY